MRLRGKSKPLSFGRGGNIASACFNCEGSRTPFSKELPDTAGMSIPFRGMKRPQPKQLSEGILNWNQPMI